MTVYAVAESVPDDVRGYLTPGKRYEVTWCSHVLFTITDDHGRELYCLWEGCAYLDGDDWTRIEADECNSEALSKLIAGDADLYALPTPSARINGDKDRATPVEGADIAEVLAEALEKARAIITSVEDYMARPDRGGWGVECACCMGELFDDDRDAISNIDAALKAWEATR